MSKIISGYKKIRQPCITIRITTPQSMVKDLDTLINLHDTVVVNQGGNDISVLNAKFTVHTAGIYLLVGDISFDANSTGFRSAFFRKSTETNYHRGRKLMRAASVGHTHLSMDTILKLSKDEDVEIFIYQNTAGNLDVPPVGDGNASEISIYKL